MKFSRTRLARGTRLIADHLFKPIYDFGLALGPGLDPDNRPEMKTAFRVTIHTGQISGLQQFYHAVPYTDAEGTRPFCFPFIIPQPQETLNSNARENADTVRVSLKELSVSFDQNGENAVIVAPLAANFEGSIDHNRVGAAHIGISVVEKRAIPFSMDTPLIPEKTLFSAELGPAAIGGKDYRLNPFVFENINAALSPYATHALMIDAEFLRMPDAPAAGDNHYSTLPSFMVSMVFSCDYIDRDAGNLVQNIPSSHDGARTSDPITITKPAGGDPILSAGVESQFNLIEGRLVNRLWSGYSRQSDIPAVESFAKDSGLEVIAVPLWQNFGMWGRLTGKTVSDAPNLGGAIGDPAVDERIIQIGYPFTIHHVLLVNNYAAGAGITNLPAALPGKPPSSVTFEGEVGVAIMTGIHGDHSAYQQVAHLNYSVATLSAYVVDRFSPQQGQALVEGSYTHEIVQVPIIQTANAGVGMKNVLGVNIAQGMPFFVGRGAGGRTELRQKVGDGSGAMINPSTQGAEMFIVVRQSFMDLNGLDAATNANVDNNTIYAGVGGNMLYIIGKKTMVGGNDPRILSAV